METLCAESDLILAEPPAEDQTPATMWPWSLGKRQRQRVSRTG